jgi:intracellular sulfur oxidation DsrE/DsrF family protein
MFFQLSCCSQELKKEKLKNAAAIKELQEKAEQKLQDELQRKVVRFDICLSSLLHIC